MNALIIIDMQYDFLPGGSLGVSEGDTIIKGINESAMKFDYCVYTKDWHPTNHCSFEIWPIHCVQYSHGADLSKDLIIRDDAKIIYKGTHLDVDSYSAFFDNEKRYSTPLDDFLKSHNVDTVYFCGLAIDYCIKLSAIDAASLGYKTNVLLDLSKCINVHPTDGEEAINEMKRAGVKFLNVSDLFK